MLGGGCGSPGRPLCEEPLYELPRLRDAEFDAVSLGQFELELAAALGSDPGTGDEALEHLGVIRAGHDRQERRGKLELSATDALLSQSSGRDPIGAGFDNAQEYVSAGHSLVFEGQGSPQGVFERHLGGVGQWTVA